MPAIDRRPPLGHHRLDGDDALGVGHLADAAVLGERVADDEQLFGDRLAAADNSQLAERLNAAVALGLGLQRLEELRAGIDQGLQLDLPALPGHYIL